VNSLGVMLQNTKADVLLNYQWYFIPVIFFIALVMAFVFVGDGLRDAADPYSDKQQMSAPALRREPDAALPHRRGADHRGRRRVRFELEPGEVMGLVGESGSGKSVTAKALMQLNAAQRRLRPASRITLGLESGPVDVLSLKTPNAS
jgi:ABC-type multidrug transport system fused ATPase/permease subunit